VFKKLRSTASPASFQPESFAAAADRTSPPAISASHAPAISVSHASPIPVPSPPEELLHSQGSAAEALTDFEDEESLSQEDSIAMDNAEVSIPSPVIRPVSVQPAFAPEAQAAAPSSEVNDLRELADEELEEESTPAQQWIATHVPPVRRRGGRYNLPTDILALSPVVPEQDVGREIELTKARLEKTLHDFDVPGKVTNIQRGPIITLFEVLLDPGVRASRILRIETEIRMNLAVPSVRIVAPLPNKTTIGIEVPNAIRQTVTVGEIIRKDRHFFSRENLLGIALGKDISGKNHYMDIAKMPHVLIAGASGQGKSVFMNSMIASLLYRYSPEEVRFIMIDPKMVELTLFEGIPHLLTPVITEPALAAKVLDWILMEMETRYTHFKRVRCRDIVSYNERVKADKSGQTIPYIVIVIDELADLMQTSSKEVENALWRLAQKARAVGIHMILATQRPSVDVITPHIKSNAPARIAFKVAQKTDSRIILDESGGEALLGQGDMLYRSPQSTVDRIQSPLITEQEMTAIVAETRRYGEPVFIDISVPDEDDDSIEEEDEAIDAELLAEAWKIIQETGKTSGSFLQRRLRIGYNRAANVVEALEQKGYLGPALGSRPREILKRS
jgi:S-DNA-T family DNA segregation ATPase FtsK/SpoIIIE